MQFISTHTNSKNLFQPQITVVKKFLEVVRKRNVISEFDSYPTHMINGYVFAENLLTFFSSCESPSSTVEATNTWWSPGCLILCLQHNGQVESILRDTPPPILSPRVLSHTLPHRVVLVERRNFYEERHVACFFAPIVFTDHEDSSSVCDRIWTKETFHEFGSSTGSNSGFSNTSEHIYRVSNRR